MPTLFRGLSVEPAHVDRVCSEIARTGKMRAEEGMHSGSRMADPDLVRSRVTAWLQSPASIRDELRKISTIPLAYACGDRAGSAFYARRGTGVPLIVEFEVPWESLRVDGRDFLYTVFTLWDRKGNSHVELVRKALATLFGKAILKYFDQAKGSSGNFSPRRRVNSRTSESCGRSLPALIASLAGWLNWPRLSPRTKSPATECSMLTGWQNYTVMT
jgi:hypothetical protein